MSAPEFEDVELGDVSRSGAAQAAPRPQPPRPAPASPATPSPIVDSLATSPPPAPATIRRTNSSTWWQCHFKRSHGASSDELEAYI